jgi:two-component system NtrC family sensor kinase
VIELFQNPISGFAAWLFRLGLPEAKETDMGTHQPFNTTIFFTMQKITLSLFLFFTYTLCYAQASKLDSLKQVLATARADSNKVNLLLLLSKEYMTSSPMEAANYSITARNLARQLKFKSGEAFALKNIGMVYYNQTKYVETIDYWDQSYQLFNSLGDYANTARLLNNIGSVYMNQGDDAKALTYFLKSLHLAEQISDTEKIAYAMVNIGSVYSNNRFSYDKALSYYQKALALSEQLGDQNIMGGILVNLGEINLKRDKDDSALFYFKRSLAAYEGTENIPYSLNGIGITYTRKGNYDLAKQYHQKAIAFAINLNLQLDMVQSYLGLADAFYKEGSYKDALAAYQNAREIARSTNLKKELKEAYWGLAITYSALKDFSSAFNYQTLYTNIKDTLFNLDIAQKVNSLQSNFDIQKKQAEIDMLTKDHALQALELKRQKFARNTLAAGLVFVFIITFALLRLNQKVRKRTQQVRRSLEELSAAQAQLIQAEKMASLGTLTAGVAHEIQNPLNFVNNFSEVNIDLLSELEQGLAAGDTEDVQAIMADLKANEQKIAHHGRRADAIVKGMLQHSRTNTGQKEPTDINALADEYLRLSYHGLRAKDKSFNATMHTDFDKNIGKVAVVPQDMGRVLLNLLNNAFYTVHERKKKLGDGYEPTVWVSTKKAHHKIELTIKDNGMGISKSLADKIFQPFFTTKPSGEGTGLGLSLSYDIIKAHGGELKAESNEGEGTSFIILLPA